MNYLLFYIEWDTEGQTKKQCLLPDNVVALNVPELKPGENLENNLGIMLFNAFGFNHNAFQFQVYSKSDPWHNAGGAFYPKNLAIIHN